MTETGPADETAADAEPTPTRYGVPVTAPFGHPVLHAAPDQLLDVASAARDDGFGFLVDVTAADYLAHPGRSDLPPEVTPERYEVVVALRNHTDRTLLRIRVQVPADDPVVPSLFDLWPGSEALEREVYDMFGISFADHPDMSRILMPEDWIGHPLRKDYAIGKVPVQFKAAPSFR